MATEPVARAYDLIVPDATPRPASSTDLRAIVDEVGRRIEEWRRSDGWADTEQNHHKYDLSLAAVHAVRAAPDNDLTAIAAAAHPMFAAWRPPRIGTAQAIYAAVDRLHRAVEAAGRESQI
jgi:hypothetical protein